MEKNYLLRIAEREIRAWTKQSTHSLRKVAFIRKWPLLNIADERQKFAGFVNDFTRSLSDFGLIVVGFDNSRSEFFPSSVLQSGYANIDVVKLLTEATGGRLSVAIHDVESEGHRLSLIELNVIRQIQKESIAETPIVSAKELIESGLSWPKTPYIKKLKRSNQKQNVLFIDDDSLNVTEYIVALRSVGFNVIYAQTATYAVEFTRKNRNQLDAIVVDIRMLSGKYFNDFETKHGLRTGVLLAQELGDLATDVQIIGLSLSTDPADEIAFSSSDRFTFCNKRHYDPIRFARLVLNRTSPDYANVKAFIVHGHDSQSVNDLKNYLQDEMGFKSPIVLWEKETLGLTVIEKLEKFANEADIVFCLFTPDDFVITDTEKMTGIKQSRPNVLIEFGFFSGKLGRQAGQVCILHKRNTYIPSDMGGLITIDITDGILSAKEEIRNEIIALFGERLQDLTDN